ncbi:sn-glycerol-3-phosphate transport system permease protein ugpA (plasmid) [Tsukamurella tyrosinosolvens]|uniref:Multiple sugar transport system permease protein n=1 Tax=Tsukamurella tyrosinosolvens TaxID=57704 RepID=A0A1H4Q7S1_TSUTY|nr:sugar ABC transporter permease [Tsukamurella tyrosinosolvens]KXO91631.1 sugar ABC transporter permease [Tsukamurella tyrosinosolvens]SEC15568.1 multiple sugar transport system permease protein [Tsukamurella tyrosinosolvens]VEH92940.1 sn-glycerol-3-phosphate transport system permease protein ugpA [Tsukamurella tyrosinosolvens]
MPVRNAPARDAPEAGGTWRDSPHLRFWLMTGPFLAGLAVFVLVPIGWSVWLSLFDAHNTVTPTEFVGLENYRDMLADPAFRSSLVTFVVFAAIVVPLTFAGSLALAVLVNGVRRFQAFFRSVFFLPLACSYVAASLIWRGSIFPGVPTGVANTALRAVGVEPVAWLSVVDPPWYWLVLVTLRLWLQLGFYMILFLAALQRVPRHLYEAAALDGASAWTTFARITLPQLRAVSVAVLLLATVNAFQAFDEFYGVMATAQGYPPYARPPLVYLYYVAVGDGQDFGHGGAGGVLLTALIVVVALAQGRFTGLFRTRDAR